MLYSGEWEEEFLMSEELSPAEKTKFRINYWRNLFLATVFSCWIVVFGMGKLGELLVERETQSVEPQPTQKLPSSALELAEETSTPHAVRRQETLSDGSTRLVDLEVGYEMILPPDWIVITMTEDFRNEAIVSAIAMNPEMADRIANAGEFLQEESNLLVLYFDPMHINDEVFSFLILEYYSVPEYKNIALETIVTNELKRAKEVITGFSYSEPVYKRNPNAVDYGEIIADFYTFIEDAKYEYRGLFVFIKVEKGLMAIFLAATLPSYPDFIDTFDEIINSIKLID